MKVCVSGAGYVGFASLTLTLLHRLPRAVMGPRLVLVVTLWLLVGILSAPTSPTEEVLTRLTLNIAGKQVPFTRSDLLKGVQQ
jgi:hypothetical protein